MKKVVVFLSLFFLCGYKYELSIAAIFKDEAAYLKEWIEYHKLVGVEHFYLYNNDSQDDYLTILQPYIEQHEVELIQWNQKATSWENWIYHVQPQAYTHAINLAKHQTKWLAIIDIDEFLAPITTNYVPEILKEYEDFGGIGFNWKIFGHSWLWTLPTNKLLIEALNLRAPDSWPTHLGVKSIVRPDRVLRVEHPHYVVYKEGFFHVNSKKQPLIDHEGRTNGVYYDVLAINHYWSRHGEHFYKKLKRYQPWAPHLDPEKWFLYLDHLNEVKDTSLERFYKPLQELLQ